jgi:hypothetical protein
MELLGGVVGMECCSQNKLNRLVIGKNILGQSRNYCVDEYQTESFEGLQAKFSSDTKPRSRENCHCLARPSHNRFGQLSLCSTLCAVDTV